MATTSNASSLHASAKFWETATFLPPHSTTTYPASALATGIPKDASKPFNATVNITLDLWSPMSQAYASSWITDNATGLVHSNTSIPPWGREEPAFRMNFVGVGYTVYGTRRWINGSGLGEPPSGNEVDIPTELGDRSHKYLRRFIDNDGNNQTLGAMSDLPLSVYELKMNFTNTTDVTLFNATIEIPVRTQAYVLLPWAHS